MQSVGRKTGKCKRCDIAKQNAPFYKWTSMITGESIEICKACRIREDFGSNYKNTKRYKRWKEENEV